MHFRSMLVAVSILLLTGCAGYRSCPLKRLQPLPIANSKNEKLLFDSKVFNQQESKKYLGKDVICAGFRPIQIAIANQSSRCLKFCQKNMSLKTVPTEIVAQSVFDQTTKRMVGWGIASLFIPILIIPFIVDTAWSYEANQQLMADYIAKSAQDSMLVPGSQVEGLIFVNNAHYCNRLTVSLTDENTQEKILLRTQLNTDCAR